MSNFQSTTSTTCRSRKRTRLDIQRTPHGTGMGDDSFGEETNPRYAGPGETVHSGPGAPDTAGIANVEGNHRPVW